MNFPILSILVTVLFLSACTMQTGKLEVIVENVHLLDSVPSGSGLAVHDNSIFIMGDDATQLYRLSMDMQVVEKIPLLNHDSNLYRIDKPSKHDLESLTLAEWNGQQYLLAFGSGSVSPQRDSMLIISLADLHSQQWISLAALYQQFRTKHGEVNIEASVVTGNSLFLFNRSGNRVYQFPVEQVVSLINAKGDHLIKALSSEEFSFPMVGGLKPGFSGASAFDEDHIIFSASAENLPNVYDDGDIQGSLIGILKTGAGKTLLQEVVPVKDKNEIILKDKIESLDIAGKYSNGHIKTFAVADNDDGRSKVFELRIIYH